MPGFYDYAGESPELESLETADATFVEFENEFPRTRERLISKGFRHWKKHLGFFLKYMQMMRARSPLFFAQKEAEGKQIQTWVIKEVHRETNTITLSSMEPTPPPAAFIKNRARWVSASLTRPTTDCGFRLRSAPAIVVW